MLDISRMDIRKIDLNLLLVLEVLLRAQSVTRAAEALAMSQPAMSLALRKLRATFDDPLFIRRSRGISPTPRAQQLLVPLQNLLDQVRDEVLRRPGFDPVTARRTFTFNMADVGELVFLPRLLARVRTLAPGIDLRTVSTPPERLAEAMEQGAIDLAVGYFPNLRGASIYQQRLFTHSFACVVRAGHPLAGGKLSKKQFLAAEHVVVQQEGKSHELFENALLAQGLSRRVVLSVPHFLALPLVIAESDLVATVPYAIGKSIARMTGVTLLPPPIQVSRAEVKQLWHARFHTDPENRWMRGVIAALFLEKRA